MMNKKRSSSTPWSTTNSSSSSMKEEEEKVVEWEMRPGGLLVQKRSTSTVSTTDFSSSLNISIRIAYGAIRYNISVNSQATFGELKKLVSVETGLQPDEQNLFYRGKERQNREYLDVCGVKEQSKIVLVQDPTSKERRFIEMRNRNKIQTAHRAISDISMEVDKLEDQVNAIEKSISDGKKVPDVQITTLIEMLMRQAIKLDSISTHGDTIAQKILQNKRVQKSVETLDAVKMTNAKLKPAVVTAKWETFDPPATTNWEFFD